MGLIKYNKAHTLKIVNIGQTNVGKSSILLKYTRNEFSESISNTVGIDNVYKEIIVDEQPVVLQLWDTAGQERFESIVKSYFRGVDGFLFVFDVSDERTFEYIKEKIKATRAENKEVSFGVIVANKTDLISEKKLNEYRLKLSNLSEPYGYRYYLTSAKTGENITKMFEEFAREIFAAHKVKAEQKEIQKKMELQKKNKRRGCC
ncbi:RABE1A [Ecytonucleospora hepatopenaei]|uniref:RABE1A n=1 Tax=Ecytonucleospora hepatopenaei TaxID=646526 RepID=A0A1W0E8X4_9MICR|nr:RABE1A [Ecytonucleospora hepatopenaei]